MQHVQYVRGAALNKVLEFLDRTVELVSHKLDKDCYTMETYVVQLQKGDMIVPFFQCPICSVTSTVLMVLMEKYFV